MKLKSAAPRIFYVEGWLMYLLMADISSCLHTRRSLRRTAPRNLLGIVRIAEEQSGIGGGWRIIAEANGCWLKPAAASSAKAATGWLRRQKLSAAACGARLQYQRLFNLLILAWLAAKRYRKLQRRRPLLAISRCGENA